MRVGLLGGVQDRGIADVRVALPRQRYLQLVLVVTTLIGSWYAMMIVHEFGHVLGAWATGGRVERVVLEFFAFSRTDVSPNPHPLIVVWAGPLIGVLLPLLAWRANRGVRRTRDLVVRFWAGFCPIANGAYIGGGSFGHVGDAEEMLMLGSPKWTLLAFGIVAVLGGMWVWNGLGTRFGFGKPADRGDVLSAAVFCGIAIGVVAIV